MPELTDGKSEEDILELRTNPKIARDAALIYTRENAAFLAARGILPSAALLRLAFLIGPANAHKVISAKPDMLISGLVSDSALNANPFLNGMTVGQLIERAKLEAEGLAPLRIPAIAKEVPAKPKIEIKCNLQRPSCKKWLALAEMRLKRKEAQNNPPSKQAGGKPKQQE